MFSRRRITCLPVCVLKLAAWMKLGKLLAAFLLLVIGLVPINIVNYNWITDTRMMIRSSRQIIRQHLIYSFSPKYMLSIFAAVVIIVVVIFLFVFVNLIICKMPFTYVVYVVYRDISFKSSYLHVFFSV